MTEADVAKAELMKKELKKNIFAENRSTRHLNK
jgi:hypothetical protein